MPKPLFAAFLSRYAFSQNLCCEVAANFPSVFEAVRNRLRRAVDSNRHSIDLPIDDSLRERLAGKSNKAQLQAIDNRFFGFAIDGHPNMTRMRRENAVPGECRLKAHNAEGYSLAGEGDLMFEVRGKISAGVQTAADLDEQSLTCGFARSWGWTPKGYNSLARTTARFSTIETSRFMDSRVVAKSEPQK
jgi:hypothetical protein